MKMSFQLAVAQRRQITVVREIKELFAWRLVRLASEKGSWFYLSSCNL